MLTPKSIHRGVWRRLALPAAAVLLPAALLISARPAEAAAVTVSLTRLTPCTAGCLGFTPGALAVTAGDTVTWTDPAAVACTLRPSVSLDPSFVGGRLPYTHVFHVAGNYAYHCVESPQVIATMTVAPAPGAPAVVKPVVAKATAAKVAAPDPLAVTPVVTTHTPWYVPTLITLAGLVLALLISQVGARLARDG